MAEPNSNTASVLYGINDLRVHQWELPKELAAGHVRVQMSNVGICGSDVHYLQHGRRAQVQPGKSVAVLGAGPIGLVVLMCAQAFGADHVVITDVRQSCLDFAAQHYAATTLLTTPQQAPSDLAQQLQLALSAAAAGTDPTPAAAAAATAGLQPDIVIDCVGVQQTLEAAVRAVAPGGKIVLVGMGSEQLQLPATLLTCKEVDLLGSFRYCNTYPLCISLIASKRVDVVPMITHRFPFSAAGVAEGFDTAARAAQTGAIKVMFDLQQQQGEQQGEQ